MSISSAREAILFQTADTLLAARRNHAPIADLPPELMPANEEEACRVQDIMAAAFGPIGGYKIGARGPEGVPFFAPMPKAWIAADDTLFEGPSRRLRGVEAEIAFQFTTALPPRSTPYTRDEVAAAVTCHPAIEVLESAYVDPMAVSREAMLADLQMNGGFVAGNPVANWQSIDWSQEHVKLVIDGAVRKEEVGSSPAGPDLLRLLTWLANEGAARTHGLKAGDWVTTGSWTGVCWAFPGSEAVATFAKAGAAAAEFAPEGK